LKILFDVNHPAHAHFFRNPALLLQAAGHEILFTSRKKDVTLELLDAMKLPHRQLSSLGNKGMLSLGAELISRNSALYKVVKEFEPDIMGSIGGTFIAHVGKLTRVPSMVFYDTENAHLQNAITYPLADCVITPRCYASWLPKKRHIKYAGYHELSYLHPNYFQPDKALALASGLDPDRDNYFIRLVSWDANHDVGENGWSERLLERVIAKLAPLGKIHISSEATLPTKFCDHQYKGEPQHVHHLMAYCRAFIGESATMASECSVLGVPSIYAAETGRGYTDEQESIFGLVRNIKRLEWPVLDAALDATLAISAQEYTAQGQRLRTECIDVAHFVTEIMLGYEKVLSDYQSQAA